MSTPDESSRRGTGAEAPITAYFEAGAARARDLGNRGPLRFDAAGRVERQILSVYADVGFYVFEGLLDGDELADLEGDLREVLERAPMREGAGVDRYGRPLDPGVRPQLVWARPLSDPWGGTDALNGRHAVRMEEPRAAPGAPEQAIFLMLGLFESMPSALRLSGHPGLLRVAESVNGGDFVPYNDAIFLKEPGLGAAVAWHQDGTTHWGSPDWDPAVHGFNFMAQLRKTTPANALWVVPGTHREGHIDIKERVASNGGSVRLPDAVPMLCEPGDVAICNRQCLHASFANDSPDPRFSLVWGYFRRSAVVDVEVDVPAVRRGDPPRRLRYTAEHVRSRCELVRMAIEARRERRPQEEPYVYTPFACEDGPWRADLREARLRGYHQGTIFI